MPEITPGSSQSPANRDKQELVLQSLFSFPEKPGWRGVFLTEEEVRVLWLVKQRKAFV